MSELSLEDSLRRQAEARIAGDIATYTGFMTPEAMAALRASFAGMPPPVTAYEIASQKQEGDEHVVAVRYSNGSSFVVRSRWRLVDGQWKAVHAERLLGEGEKPPSPLRRLLFRLLLPLAPLLRRRRR